jgi:predicted outer membrane repeat protein
VISLRDALNIVNAHTTTSTTQTIRFDPIVFATQPTITLSAGPLSLTDTRSTISIIGPVKIDGAGKSSVFRIASGVTADLTGLSITDGGIDLSGQPGGNLGGGIDNAGALTLTVCTVTGNTSGSGGGIYNTGTLTVLGDSVLSRNSATNGGGIYNTGTVTVQANSALDLYNNSATNGGGIYNTGSATIDNSTLSGNSASAGGGAIYNAGTLNTQADLLFSNSACWGGALANAGLGWAQDTGSSIYNNVAVEGAGIANYGVLLLGQTSIYSNDLRAATTGDVLPSGGVAEGGGLYNNVLGIASRGGSSMTNNYDADLTTLDNIFGSVN